MFTTKAIPDEIIDARITSFKNVYLFFTIVGGLAGILMFAGKRDIAGVPGILLNVVVYFAAYYGLKEKRKWAIPLILIFSAYILLGYFFSNRLTTASGRHWAFPIMLMLYLIHFVIVLFYSYQIYFFSKKEVREYLGIKGIIIFS